MPNTFNVNLSFQDRFSLDADVERMLQVCAIGAHEASILYATRILDVLISSALESFCIDVSVNLFSNLRTLETYGLIPQSVRYWAHGLRSLGNDVRHIRRPVVQEDTDLAMALIDRCISWGIHFWLASDKQRKEFFSRWDLPRLVTTPMRQAMLHCEQFQPGESGALRHWVEHARTLPAASWAVGAVIEKLIEQRREGQALELLRDIANPGPLSFRLQQLRALIHSRTGDLETAIRDLEELRMLDPRDDETIGMLAGAYKRVWFQTNAESQIRKANSLYREGWVSSQRSNCYLGINAATTSLWRGDETGSKIIADEVLRRLIARRCTLHRTDTGGNSRTELALWDHLTFVEATLLLGDVDGAEMEFAAACRNHPYACGAIETCREQLSHLAASMLQGHVPKWLMKPKA